VVGKSGKGTLPLLRWARYRCKQKGGEEQMKALSWVNFILGLWLIVAPFALHYRELNARDISAAMSNNVVVGIVIAIFAIFRALDRADIEPLPQHHNAH